MTESLLDSGVWQAKIFSGGWVPAHGGDMPIIEPATGSELGRAGRADNEDLERAVAAAAAAQKQWGPPTSRSAPPYCAAPATCSPNMASRSAAG